MHRRIATALLFSLPLVTGLTGAARAGSYHVYSCRTPAGEPAPVDGWSGSKSGTYTYVTNSCGEAGALMAALGDQPLRMANTDFATWAFSAPPSAFLTAATIWRAGDAAGGGNLNALFGLWFAAPINQNNPAHAFGQCTGGVRCPSGIGTSRDPLSAENRLSVPAANLGPHVYANVSCFGESGYECPQGQGDANGFAAVVYLYAADLTLEQTAGPSASGVGGELAGVPAVAGTSDLTFTATDPGAGVYEAVFSVDGRVVQRTVVDGNGGRCREVGQSGDGLPAFLYLQPCLSSVSADVGFDTTRAANGPHHLIVSVQDAAGNVAPVLDRTVTIANPGVPGPPNGQGASTRAALTARWRGARGSALTAGYRHAETILGRLTALGGAPISAAQIDVTATPSFAGARGFAMRGALTGADGRFAIRVPAGASSRALTLAYRTRLGDLTPAVTRGLRLLVRAPVSLKIFPRTASVGATIHFRGRLAGGPIPSGGKAMVLEARSGPGRWIEFDVLRSDRRGRFRSSYRFKFPGPAVYEFRAVCEQEADYPYARGVSRVVRVVER